MSLHLGNLSSRIRRDDLERIFSRFGRNSIRIKDGYGFVVYDLPENAEKALRALRGKNICGERISLTWSNKQPKPIQSFTKGSRFYEPYNGRNFERREDHATRKESSHHERRFKRVNKLPDVEGGGPHMDEDLDKEKDHPCDDAVDHGEEKRENVKESAMDEGFPIESNIVDSGRWGEPVSGSLDRKEVENGTSLDLYEPYHSYDRRHEDENRYRPTSYSSSTRGSSGEKSRKDPIINTTLKHAADSEYQLKCYICGKTGHIRRNCPQGNAFRQEKFARFDRRDNLRVRGKRGLKRVTPASWRMSNSKTTHPSSRRNKRDGNSRDQISPSAKGKESQRNKRRKREDRNSAKEGRTAERAGSSPRRSDSTASGSRSRSASLGTKSCSRSRSSKTHSVSSSSRSMTSSSKSRSEHYRSRSRSDSPASLSLSVSLCPRLRSSSSKADMEDTGTSPNNHLEKDNRSASKQILIDKTHMIRVDANTENSKLKNTNSALLDENSLPSIKVDDEMNTSHNDQLHEDGNHEFDKTGCKLKVHCVNPSEIGMTTVDILYSESSGERTDLEKPGPPEMEDTQVASEKQYVEVPSTVQSKDSTSISSQEMYRVLKHYGLAIPNENDENLSVDAYFGSARLWPWEIIYYRRLKKGPISTENYARRIAQNEEFGIVDKYIRSSSGWGEFERSSC